MTSYSSDFEILEICIFYRVDCFPFMMSQNPKSQRVAGFVVSIAMTFMLLKYIRKHA